MRRASLNTSVLSPILQCSSLLSSAQSSHQRIYNNAEIFNIPLTVVWFDKDCVSINKLLIQWSQLQAQSSFNLQGNASSFKHSQQFLGKNCFRKVKHYMQHIFSSSISSYISLGIKCISPMTTAYHPCLIQRVHSTLFIHMNIFAKFRFYALPSLGIIVHELQYSNIYIIH